MKKEILSIAVAGLLMSTASAQAQTFTPNTSYAWAGVVGVNKPSSPSFMCTLEVEINPASSTGADSDLVRVDFSQAGPTPAGICEAITVTNLDIGLTWNASARSWTTNSPLYVQTPTPGDCAGGMTVSLGANPNPTMSVSAVLPWVWNPGDCTIISLSPLALDNPGSGSVG